MENMEEGELDSSSESEFEGNPIFNDFDYTELPRPARPVVMTDPCDGNATNFGQNGPDSEDEDILNIHASSSDSDSDGREPRRSKVQRTMTQPGPRASGKPNGTMEIEPQAQGGLASFNHFAKSYQTRRQNNIWANVIQEERMTLTTEGLEKIGVGENDDVIRIDRGPESFVIQKNVILKRHRTSECYEEDGQDLSGKDDSPESLIDVQLSESVSSDISSAGLTDDTKAHIRAAPVQSGLGIDNQDDEGKVKGTRRQKNMKKFANLSDSQLARFLNSSLEETNLFLFETAVKLLGRDVLLHLYFKTLSIQKSGGILIKNRRRHRTIGGVFFYLMKVHPLCDSDIVQQVFNARRELQEFNASKERRRVLRVKAKSNAEAEAESVSGPSLDQ